MILRSQETSMSSNMDQILSNNKKELNKSNVGIKKSRSHENNIIIHSKSNI